MIAMSTVITRAQRIFKDLQSATIVDYANEVHDDLCRKVPQILATEDITLVAAQQEYTLLEASLQIYHAEYWTSATYRVPLNAFDVTAWDIQSPNWRAVPQGQPTFYAAWRNSTDNVLVLHPKPATATTGGYPMVRLYVSRGETLTSSGNLPKGISSADVYVFGIAMRYAADRVPSKFAFYEKRYEKALSAEIRAKQINIKAPPQKVNQHVPRIGRI